MQFKFWLGLPAFLIFVSAAVPCTAAVNMENPAPGLSIKAPFQKTENRKFKEGELLIKFKSSVPESRKDQLHKKHGSEKIKDFPALRIEHVKLEKGLSVHEAVRLYKNDPDVEYAEPNLQYEALVTPNDPNYSQLWGLTKINAPAAWDSSTGSNSVVVAVIDTGLDYNHADLAANIWTNPAEIPGNGVDDDADGYVNDIHGISAVLGSGDPMDDHGHGTHVAGTIGAVGNNGAGIVGVNWNVKMIGCKFLDANGKGSTSNAITCLQYVKSLKDRGVNIVATNNSWGCGGNACYSQALYDAIDAQRDILFIAAAGNNSLDNDDETTSHYPASYDLPNVISVGASDSSDSKASFSNYGRHSVHVAAPGDGIFSTMSGTNHFGFTTGYGTLSGTSMAAPHVTGLAALLKSQDSGRDGVTLRNLLLAGGDPVASLAAKTITGRRINAFNSQNCSGRQVFSVLKFPDAPATGVAQTISALSITCGLPAGPVTMTPGLGETVTLHDDGSSPDIVAGDGIFTGTWTPAREVEVLTFSAPGGSEIEEVPRLAITTVALPEVSIYSHYSAFLTASGGKPAYNWTLTSGVLPAGLSLNSLTGELSGNTTVKGKYTLAFKATDGYGFFTEKTFTLYVSDDILTVSRIITFTNPGVDSATGVAVDGSGNVCVVGYSGDADQQIILKYDPAGNLLWNRTYPGTDATGIAVDGTGNIYVTGADFLTSKFDSSGNLLWTRTYGGGHASSIAVDVNGNVHVAGTEANTGGNIRNFMTLKYDPSGNLLWARTYDDGAYEYGYGVAVDAGGNIYVTGVRFSSWPDSSLLTIKYSPSGGLLWSKAYKATVNDEGTSIAVDSAGNVLITGDSGTGAYGGNYLAIKYDPSGNLLWSSPFTYNNAYGRGIAVDADGNSYITGDDYAYSSTRDCSVIKHDASGNLVWNKHFDSGATDFCNGIIVGSGKNLYVAGQINPSIASASFADMLLVNFRELDTWLVNLSQSGTGTGSVGFSPGTNCSTTCSQRFVSGVNVVLTATPNADSFFAGWEGACTGTGSCTLTMDGNKEATAVFMKKMSLSYGRFGSGTGTVVFTPGGSCSGSCSQSYITGTPVTLTAEPDSDSEFSGWEDACTGTGTCSISMDGNKQITAVFVKKYSLNYSRLGSGMGTVAVLPGTSCGDNCSQSYRSGTEVTLTVTPGSNSVFTGWSGACSGTGSCTVSMTEARQVGATFSRNGMSIVSAGQGHTLALKWDGTLWAWGNNTYGQLGDGTNTDRTSPVQVAGLTGVIDIATGLHHSLALKADGTVWAWGNNGSGQLGDGSKTSRPLPGQVPGLANIIAVAGGNDYTIALAGNGTLWAWGDNSSGQFGDDSKRARHSPVQVPNLADVTAIAAANGFTLALKRDGTVWAWGTNSLGELGDGTITQHLTPTRVGDLTNVVAIDSGESYSVAVKVDGTMWAWGDNQFGQLGDGTTTQRLSPVTVAGSFAGAAAGGGHTLALDGSNTVSAWGRNGYGELGDGTTTQRASAVPVPGLSAVSAVTAGTNHSLAVKRDGTVVAWGDNTYGQLGDGTNTNSYSPVQVPGFKLLPPAATIGGTPPSPTNGTGATLNVGGADVVAYTFKLDVGSYSGETPVGTPISLTSLGEGTHTVSILAKDSAGRWQATATTASWTVDLTPPAATLSGAPASPSDGADVSLTVGGTDVFAFRYTQDGGAYSATMPAATPISLNSPGEGTHTVSVVARDSAGNWQVTPTAVSWTVDLPVTVTGGRGYTTVQEAYNAILSDNEIRIKRADITEALLFNRNVGITLRGGFDPTTGTSTGLTNIHGNLDISSGTVTVENVALMP